MVFKAHDTEQRPRGRRQGADPRSGHSEEQKERFVRAMKTMLPIRHPNIVRLVQCGEKGPYCWAAMEYVEGESLTQVIDRMGVAGMLDWRARCGSGRRACRPSLGRGVQAEKTSFAPQLWRRPISCDAPRTESLPRAGRLDAGRAIGGNARQAGYATSGRSLAVSPYMSPERTPEQRERGGTPAPTFTVWGQPCTRC